MVFSRLFGQLDRFGVSAAAGGDEVKILKKGPAMRVIFFYPGEEGTYVDNAFVTLYENGIIHIKSHQEETTTHLQNCEILWRFETDSADDRASKLRLLKPKADLRAEAPAPESDDEDEAPDSDSDESPDDDTKRSPRVPPTDKKPGGKSTSPGGPDQSPEFR